jgi:anti-sigma regulatory factor (Ser/Thr protein kinase)
VNHAIVDLCRRHGFVTAGALAKRLKVSRQTAHRRLAEAVAEGHLRPEGRARARRYVPVVPQFEFPLVGQNEDRILAHIRQRLASDFETLPDQDERMLVYTFSEMVNNAIDHSRGSRVWVTVAIRPTEVEISIEDDGIGAFASIQAGRGLATPIEAAAEVTKGKVTTMPSRHTGEGVFFTSKAVDRFQLAANGVALLVDNLVQDHTIHLVPLVPGTRVDLRFARPVLRTMQSVFAAWTEDIEFSRTRTIVKLFGLGRDFVSRSEARRLLHGLEAFREVVVDFAGVQAVGQGFADEVFRVFARQHPDIRLVPVNMVEPVRFFVERAERARQQP